MAIENTNKTAKRKANPACRTIAERMGARIIPMLLWLAAPASAQITSAAQPVPAADDGQGIAPIVVTAQRRSERLQDVPISVTAITASEMDKSGVADSQSLQLAVPGLAINRTGNEGNIYIRGVGTNLVGPNVEQEVGVYVDGVYYASPEATIFGFNNIERIEVLKGPQGTLFGRNTTGGVIQIITKDPSHDPSLDVDVGYANYDTVNASLYGTTGLSDNTAIDFAGTYSNQGIGWGHNLYNGQDIDQQAVNDVAFRSKLLIDLTPSTVVKVTGDYTHTYDNNTYKLAPGVTGPDGTHDPGFYNANSNFPEYGRLNASGISMQVDQGLGDLKLLSISAYRNLNSLWSLNQDGVPASLTQDVFPQHVRTFTQELQLLGPKTTHFDWMVGAYYFSSRAGFDDASVALVPGNIFITDFQDSKSYAAFAQGTYNITPSTGITLGLRETYEDQNFQVDEYSVFGSAPPVPNARQSFDKLTYRLALNQKFSEDIMGYVSYNTGFKSGGYNVAGPTDAPYKPESIDAYEVGLKTTTFDRRLLLNGAAFWYDWTNIQAQIPVPGGTIVLNGPKAQIKGLEFDLEARLTNALTLSGGASYLHGRYLSYPNAPFVNPNGVLAPPPTDASGNTTIDTPTFMGNLMLDYKIQSPVGAFNPSISTSYNSGFFYYPDNRIQQPAYALLNAGLSWTPANERYMVRVWGRNLTDREYYIGRSEQVGNADIDRPAAPRTYGVTFSAHFR
jgi:iron complex outermembrane receptor protein